MKRTSILRLITLAAFAQSNPTETKKPKTGLWPEDWKYTLAEGVTAKEVAYYSDGTACFAKIFSRGAGQDGWRCARTRLGRHALLHREVWRTLCERGLVAMVIDYRGWGTSDGFV